MRLMRVSNLSKWTICLLDNESHTSANLGNDRRNILSISMRHFGEAQSKVMRVYTQNGQCHTIVESRDS